MKTTEAILEEILEDRLRTKISLPETSALAQQAKLAYRAGWAEATDVSGNLSENNPDTHPADRSRSISDARMDSALRKLPKTGAGKPSGNQHGTKQTFRRYAARGYRDRMEQATLLGWRDFLSSNPGQAAGEMLERRIICLDTAYSYGTASRDEARNLDYLPRTRGGRQWMMKQARLDLDQTLPRAGRDSENAPSSPAAGGG